MHIVQFSLISLYYVKKAVLKGFLVFKITERIIYFSDAKSTRSKSLDNLLPAGTEENFFGLSESKLNQRYLSQVKLSFFSLSLSVCLSVSIFHFPFLLSLVLNIFYQFPFLENYI